MFFDLFALHQCALGKQTDMMNGLSFIFSDYRDLAKNLSAHHCLAGVLKPAKSDIPLDSILFFGNAEA